jgi:hypothetical protein
MLDEEVGDVHPPQNKKHRQQNDWNAPQIASTLLASEHHRPHMSTQLQYIPPRFPQRSLGS